MEGETPAEGLVVRVSIGQTLQLRDGEGGVVFDSALSEHESMGTTEENDA